MSGRAAIGYYKHISRRWSAAGSEASGTNVRVLIPHSSRTSRFTVGASRRLEYSYLASLYNYVEAGINLSVTQRLGESWDVVGRLGRARLIYGQSAPAGLAVVRFPDETVFTYGVDLGYNVGRIRIGGYVDHNQRDEDEPTLLRGFRRLRVGSSATYVF